MNKIASLYYSDSDTYSLTEDVDAPSISISLRAQYRSLRFYLLLSALRGYGRPKLYKMSKIVSVLPRCGKYSLTEDAECRCTLNPSISISTVSDYSLSKNLRRERGSNHFRRAAEGVEFRIFECCFILCRNLNVHQMLCLVMLWLAPCANPCLKF